MTETLSFQADIDALTHVAEWVEGVADRLALPDQTRFALDLCLEEALANVIRYGFPDGTDADRTVRVGLDRDDDAVLVTVEDHGLAYDPLATAEPVLPSTLDEAPVGGLGVHLMRQFTQQMAYQRRDDTNRLILRIGTTEVAPDPAS